LTPAEEEKKKKQAAKIEKFLEKTEGKKT